MADFAELLDLIAQGIDPTTGEVVDVEELKRDKAFLDSVKRLNQKFCVKKESRGKLRYEDYEKRYPEFVIVMKEGIFYSAHNDSARVLNFVLDYKLSKDSFGRVSTGGPDVRKISDALESHNFSYLIVEKGAIRETYHGRNAFKVSECAEESSAAKKTAPKHTSGSQETDFPYNLLRDIVKDTSNLPRDVAERLDEMLGTITSNKGRDLEILLYRYRDGESLQKIANRYGISRERVRLVLMICRKKLRKKAVVKYLTEKAPSRPIAVSFSEKESVTPAAPLRLRPNQIRGIEISENQNITIDELARKITVAKDPNQKGTIKYSHVANWLVAKGDLKEEKSDLDCMRRRPTPQGAAKGIKVETRPSGRGTYSAVVLDKRAQRYILDHLDEICRQ